MLWILLLTAFLINLSAYDTSFSSIIKEVYEENHTSAGDWCDQIASATQKKGRHLSSVELEQEGIDPDYLDAMALAFCKKYPDTYIATVWPTLSYDIDLLLKNP